MEQTGAALIALVKSALTGQPAQLPADLNWQEILRRSAEHQIVSLVLEGMTCSNAVDPETKADFIQKSYLELVQHQKQMGALRKLQTAFGEQGIDHLLLKGTLLKGLYPNPEHRVMSDMDILIRLEQYAQIRAVMEQMGFQEGIETDHELVWHKSRFVYIELHKRLIPSYNSDYYTYYENGWSMAQPTEKPHCFALRDEDHLVFLVTHFAKHYRDGGIGVRHLTDIWLFVSQKELNHGYLEAELEKLRLLQFYKNILRTGAVWFDGGADDEITAFMTERILESGSYGIQEKSDAALAVRESKKYDTVGKAQRGKLKNTIFMPREQLKKTYPVLERHPGLLPVMWVARWGKVLATRPKNILRKAQQVRKINSEVVDQYSAELEKVGLSFDL